MTSRFLAHATGWVDVPVFQMRKIEGTVLECASLFIFNTFYLTCL